jgi:hypothetical protein
MPNITVMVVIAALSGAAVPDAAAQADPLRGPEVGSAARPGSLVSRGMSGELLALDAPPAIAAVELLDLDAETAERVQGVLAERAALVEEFVFANLRLLSEFEGIMTAGSVPDRLGAIARGLAALEPVRSWGELDERIEAVLTPAQRGRYRALITEYESASLRVARAAGEARHAWQHRMARHWADLAWEIERAAARVLRDDEVDFVARLVEPLGLSSEQEGRIRARIEGYLFALGRRPTQADQFRVIELVKRELTVEQRWRLVAMVLRGELDPESGG